MEHRGPRIGITIAALGALVIYMFADTWWPDSVVARIDTGALGLLALAFLPWLAYLVDEFKFGGFEGKLRSATRKADEAADVANEAKAAATEARAAAAEAIAAANEASAAAAEARAVAEDQTTASPDSPPLKAMAKPHDTPAGQDVDALLALAQSYIDQRQTDSGPERTSRMTTIFGQMQNAARHLGPGRTDVTDWLGDPDSGRQLAAIAYLRSFPETVPVSRLVTQLQSATEAFVQYWTLRVLHGRVDANGLDGVSINDRQTLRAMQDANLLGRATDRATQLAALNRKLDLK